MTATLASNGGDAELMIELSSPAQYAGDAGFDSSLHLRGRHWDGDHTFPFCTSIEGLWLRKADLTGLREHISSWLSKLLDGLITDDLNADFELARLPGQSLHIRFGQRPDTISGRHPVITISFSAGKLRSEFCFVTDQSCLALFVQELPRSDL
jgi:hypothetical protein